MSQKYFLDDGIEYMPETGELRVGEQIETLQSLENKILNHFVTHPNQLVTKDALYNVGWSGRIHGDNPLSKTISNLRSKLGDDSRNPKFIKTVPKMGFRFVSEVSLAPKLLDLEELERKSELGFKPKHLKQLTMLIFIASILWIGTQLFSNPLSDTLAPQVSKIQQLTRTKDQERYPNLSQNGKYLAFTRQPDQDNFKQIIVKQLVGGIEYIITQDNAHHSNPKWHPTKRQLLYQKTAASSCEIRLITLTEQMTVEQDRVLSQCAPYDKNIGLSWGPNDTIFYTDTGIQFAAQKIYQLDINTSKRSIFASPQITQGRGYYRLNYDHKARKLFALLNNDWYNTVVITFDLKGNIETQHEVKVPLYAVTSYKQKPAFKTDGNHIHFLNDQQEGRLMQSPLWPIYFPNIVNTGNQTAMAFIGGEFFHSDLVLIDQTNNTEQLLVSGDVANKLPTYHSSGDLYYISNRSGVYQIWRLKDGENQQISQFESNMHISDLKVSWNEKFIAITVHAKITIFELNSDSIELDNAIYVLDGHVNPYFDPDNKTFWASEDNAGTFRMHQFSLSDANSKAITTIDNAFIGIFDTRTKEHFMFKYDQQGIWKVTNNNLKWFNNAPVINNSRSIQLNNHKLAYYSDEHAKIMQLSLDDGSIKPLINGPYRHFSQVYNPNKPHIQQFIVKRRKFGNTDIYIAYY